MAGEVQAVVTTTAERPREAWDDPVRGSVAWYTLFSGDRTPTNAMTAGIAEIVPGGGSLQLHRHEQPEIYYIIKGTGLLVVDGVERTVSAGTAVFIPGNAEHGLRNVSDSELSLFYVFPTDSFSDVVYRFPE
jgi:mannose-6-phosphate isomerase-like protein (cupin superfamily)